MNRFLPILALGALPALATASDLDLSIESGGLNAVTVSPGQVVSYDIVGELTDSLNEGLALFVVDLSMPGATLTPLATPTTGNMAGFVTTNEGYSEMPSTGNLEMYAGRRAMGYYDHTDLPFYYWLANTFAIGDRYFSSMPGPVSRTVTLIPPLSLRFDSTVIWPPSGVNFTALLSRLSSTCFTARLSTLRSGR